MNAQQLKNAILQEAIEGRLVPQDPNDEPASVLLARIRKEKERLVKERIIKKDKNESSIYRAEDGHWMEHFEDKKLKDICIDDEIPFEIPNGWNWVRWGMLGDYKKGPFGSSLTKSMFVPKSPDAVKVYEQKNAIQKDFSLGEYYISKEKYNEMIGFTVNPRDIIVSCAGTIGETYLLPDNAPIGIINQALMRARLHDSSIVPYWMLYFRYILVIENKLKGSGSAIKNIPPFEELKAMLVAVPPLNEQKRILSKYEELLPKVEEYGKAQEALNKLNAELPEHLKKSILQEAIEGRLVPQDPNDEPASVLLDKIRQEKAQLVKTGKLKKKDLEVKPITEDEIPFEIPDTWEWVRLGNVCDYIHRGKSPKYGEKKILPIIAQKCNQWERIYTDRCLFAQEDTIEKYTEDQFIRKGDVIINSTGGGTVGRTGYVDDHVFKVYKRFVVDSHVTIVRGNKNLLGKYIYYYLISPLIQFGLEDRCSGSTNQIELGTTTICNYLFPFPPFAEQQRIVEKLELLLGEVDKLKIK
jgi:type I restriction enzyme S subunit